MKITQKFGNVSIEINADTLQEALVEFGEIEAIFGNTKCGHCGGTDILHKHRTAKGFDFFESECQSCKHSLHYSETVEGKHMYAVRLDLKTRQLVGENGWVPPYKSQANSNEPVQQQAANSPAGPPIGEDDIPF